MSLTDSQETKSKRSIVPVVGAVVFLLLVALVFFLPGTSVGDSIAGVFGYERSSKGTPGLTGQLNHPLSTNVNNLGQQYCVNELDRLLGTLPSGNYIGYNQVTDDGDVAQSFIAIQNAQLSISVDITTIPQEGDSCTFSVERTRIWGNTCPQLQQSLFPDAELLGNLNGRWLLRANDRQHIFLERINDSACLLINKRLISSEELAAMLRAANQN